MFAPPAAEGFFGSDVEACPCPCKPIIIIYNMIDQLQTQACIL